MGRFSRLADMKDKHILGVRYRLPEQLDESQKTLSLVGVRMAEVSIVLQAGLSLVDPFE